MRILTVTTTGVSGKLISVNDAATRLNVSTSQYGTVLSDLIDEVTAAFNEKCERHLEWQAYTEKIPGSGGFHLHLSNAPVDSTGLSITYQPLTSTSSTAISSTAYRLDAVNGIVYISTGLYDNARLKGDFLADRYSGSEDPAYTVTYTAGYAIPSTSTGSGSKMPLELRSAAFRTVQLWWNDLGLDPSSTSFKLIRTEDFELQSFDADARSLSGAAMGIGDLPESVCRILERYKLSFF